MDEDSIKQCFSIKLAKSTILQSHGQNIVCLIVFTKNLTIFTCLHEAELIITVFESDSFENVEYSDNPGAGHPSKGHRFPGKWLNVMRSTSWNKPKKKTLEASSF